MLVFPASSLSFTAILWVPLAKIPERLMICSELSLEDTSKISVPSLLMKMMVSPSWALTLNWGTTLLVRELEIPLTSSGASG